MSERLYGCRGVRLAKTGGRQRIKRAKFPYTLTIVQRLTEETHTFDTILQHGGRAVVVAYGKSPKVLHNFMKQNNPNEQNCRERTISGPEGDIILD